MVLLQRCTSQVFNTVNYPSVSVPKAYFERLGGVGWGCQKRDCGGLKSR